MFGDGNGKAIRSRPAAISKLVSEPKTEITITGEKRVQSKGKHRQELGDRVGGYRALVSVYSS